MRIFRKILIIIAVIMLVVAAVGLLFFPAHIHVERSTVINQKPSMVFNYVSDLHQWNNWSPWYKRDPNAKYIFAGPESGKGSSLSWESNVKDVGNGKMTITDAEPDSLIRQDLNFMENGVAKSSFRLSPEGEGTKITWAFDSDAGANPMMRIMGAFMDKFVGPDFESGLNSLKEKMESMHEVHSDSLSVQ